MKEKNHIINASLTAFILISIYIPTITIVAEFFPTFKSWLTITYGHHWIGKGIIMIAVYVVIFALSYFVLKSKKTELSARLVTISAYCALTSSTIISLFFVYEYLIH